MEKDTVTKAKAYLALFLAENQEHLWPEEIRDLSRAVAILHRFKV